MTQATETVPVRMLQGMGNGATGIAYNVGDIVRVPKNAADAWIKHGVAEAAPPGAKPSNEPSTPPPPSEEPRTTTRTPPRTTRVGPQKPGSK